jgi:hypothetical protein
MDITLNLSDANVTAILTQINGAVKSAGKYAAYVADNNVTADTVKDHARALADAWADKYAPKTNRAQKVDGKRTPYGNAVQAAGNGLRAALDKDESAPKPVALRVSLSGEGGGSAVVPVDHPLYEAICAIIAEGK